MRNVAKGLENKIIELQQNLDEKVSCRTGFLICDFDLYYGLVSAFLLFWFGNSKSIQPVKCPDPTILST